MATDNGMSEVTVWLSHHDDTTTSDIADVINGELAVAELTGVTPDGTQVTVRFLRSDELEDNPDDEQFPSEDSDA